RYHQCRYIHSFPTRRSSDLVDCSIVAIFRALHRNGITRKKKTRFAEERDSPRVQEQRHAFCEEMATVPANHVVFIDETGATTARSEEHTSELQSRSDLVCRL